jgi:hypothetical protein
MPDGHGLIPLDDVSGRLGLKGQSYVGVRPIPIERIIGTVDRNQDFDREFRPRRGHIGQRLASVRGTFPAGDFPPISVFEIGGSYFVSDGHKTRGGRSADGDGIDRRRGDPARDRIRVPP